MHIFVSQFKCFPLLFSYQNKKDKKDEPECLVWDLSCRVRSLFVSFCVSASKVCVCDTILWYCRWKKCHYPLSKINTLWRCCCVSIFNIYMKFIPPPEKERPIKHQILCICHFFLLTCRFGCCCCCYSSSTRCAWFMTLLLAQKLNLLGRLSELSVHIIEYIYINNNTHTQTNTKESPELKWKKCHLLNEILLLLHCTRVPKILFLL